MSSRITSDFGTLGERVAAMRGAGASGRPVVPARHVWVTTATGADEPGLLVGWVRDADGSWWGRVATSDAPGEASLSLVNARLLKPVGYSTE